MEPNINNTFKTWKEVKDGDTIYYYDHGKIREQIVHSAKMTEETHEYNYGLYRSTSTEEYILISAGRGSKFKVYSYYINSSYYPSHYFTRFTCKEALIDALQERLKKVKRQSDKAKQRYEKFLSIYNKYDKLISDYEKLLKKD